MNALCDVTIMILAGGMGTRLRPRVSDRPKPLADIAGRPFITYLLDSLLPYEPESFIVCTGHKGEMFEKSLGSVYKDVPLIYSHEEQPMGTGGALRLALAKETKDLILVLNGDSFCHHNTREFVEFHQLHRGLISVLLTNVQDTTRYGTVQLDTKSRIVEFKEKHPNGGAGLINAGIYLIQRCVIARMPIDAPTSIERDVFPQYVGRGLMGFPHGGAFIDIGVPQAYDYAQEFFK